MDIEGKGDVRLLAFHQKPASDFWLITGRGQADRLNHPPFSSSRATVHFGEHWKFAVNVDVYDVLKEL